MLVRMIGMDSVGHVHGEQHAVPVGLQKLIAASVQSQQNPLQHRRQEGGTCALLGTAADLLVVEVGSHVDSPLPTAFYHSCSNGLDAGQIVQTG